METTEKLERLARTVRSKRGVSGLALALAQPSTGLSWTFGPGTPYAIASITKLFTTAMVMQLCDEGAISLDTRAAGILGDAAMARLNLFGGQDHGPDIAIRQLLAHRSGIADYFEQSPAGEMSVLAKMLEADRRWSAEELLAAARATPANFAPATPGKARYSDTNYLLLGRIIAAVTGVSYERALRARILGRVGLDHTFLFTVETYERFGELAPIYHGKTALCVPKALASFGAEGGIVSTPWDQIRFLRAFMGGKLFAETHFSTMASDWRSVFSPLVPIEYGTGLMRFRIPRWQSPFFAVPPMLGHSGAFGTVLFHVPDRDLYIAGTLNQMVPRSLPYSLLVRLALAVPRP